MRTEEYPVSCAVATVRTLHFISANTHEIYLYGMSITLQCAVCVCVCVVRCVCASHPLDAVAVYPLPGSIVRRIRIYGYPCPLLQLAALSGRTVQLNAKPLHVSLGAHSQSGEMYGWHMNDAFHLPPSSRLDSPPLSSYRSLYLRRSAQPWQSFIYFVRVITVKNLRP